MEFHRRQARFQGLTPRPTLIGLSSRMPGSRRETGRQAVWRLHGSPTLNKEHITHKWVNNIHWVERFDFTVRERGNQIWYCISRTSYIRTAIYFGNLWCGWNFEDKINCKIRKTHHQTQFPILDMRPNWLRTLFLKIAEIY